MFKLPKEKRDRILQILGGVGVVLGLLWYFMINAEKENLKKIVDDTDKVQDKISKAEGRIKGGAKWKPELASFTQKLTAMEEEMFPATASTRRGRLTTILSGSSLQYIVRNESAVESEPLPKFPYKAVNLQVEFSARYDEFGRFLAEFENRYRYITLVNLVIRPSADAPGNPEDEKKLPDSSDKEKLQFTLDFVALYRPPSTL